MTPAPLPPPRRPPLRSARVRHERAPAGVRKVPVVVPARRPGAFDRYGRWLLVGCALFSLGVHLTVKVGITSLPERPARAKPAAEVLEFAVVPKPPPEPPKPPEPKKIVKLEKRPPKRVVKVEAPPPPEPPPPEAPPPPVEEAKEPDPTPPPIIGGLNNLSFTTGPSNLTMNRGNSLHQAISQIAAKPEDVKPYRAEHYAPAYQLTEMPSCDPLDGAAFRKEYPEEARRAEIEGQVKMKLVIDDDGAIARTDVLKDPGYGLGRAARKIVRNMKCRPGKQNGQAVATEIPFTLTFELDY